MYLGHMVEIASHKIFTISLYILILKHLFLQFHNLIKKKRTELFYRGELPSPSNPPSGCPFQTRCPLVQDKCKEKPQLREVINGHKVACFI